MEEGPCLLEALRGADAGGVEDERLEGVLLGCRLGIPHLGIETGVGGGAAQVLRGHGALGLRIDRGQRLRDGGREARLGRRSEQHRAVYDRLPRLVALKWRRRGQSDLLGDDAPDWSVDQLLVAVCHGYAASMIAV